MSVFGKSQRYLAVLQKVSDLEMRLESIRTEMERQSLAHQAAEIPVSDEEIAMEIEKRFRDVLNENVPALVSEVRKAIEGDLDLEAVVGKEVFRLLESHLPELTAKEITEEEISTVTEEVAARMRREIEGIVESQMTQLMPLVEKESASSIRDEIRPRLDQHSESNQRVWEEVSRLKSTVRKMAADLEDLKQTPSTDVAEGSAMVPGRLLGRASIENIVNERVQNALEHEVSSREKRIASVEHRLARLARTFESSDRLLQPAQRTPARQAAGRRKKKEMSDKDKDAALDRILNTELRVRER